MTYDRGSEANRTGIASSSVGKGMHGASVNPTAGQIAVLIEVVNHSTEAAAATALGLSRHTVYNHLRSLYRRIGAADRTQAVRILWPVVGDALLPGRPDRRTGRERRAA